MCVRTRVCTILSTTPELYTSDVLVANVVVPNVLILDIGAVADAGVPC